MEPSAQNELLSDGMDLYEPAAPFMNKRSTLTSMERARLNSAKDYLESYVQDLEHAMNHTPLSVRRPSGAATRAMNNLQKRTKSKAVRASLKADKEATKQLQASHGHRRTAINKLRPLVEKMKERLRLHHEKMKARTAK